MRKDGGLVNQRKAYKTRDSRSRVSYFSLSTDGGRCYRYYRSSLSILFR